MKELRIYLDCSVFGGCFDEEFETASVNLIARIQKGQYKLLVSAVLLGELAEAPQHVREVFEEVPSERKEMVRTTREVVGLRNAYLAANILTDRWIDDATHVAVATVGGADAIVSWNFRHMVNLRKIVAFNEVNIARGYRVIHIISPTEFTDEYEDKTL